MALREAQAAQAQKEVEKMKVEEQRKRIEQVGRRARVSGDCYKPVWCFNGKARCNFPHIRAIA
jgi:hypothetical protein